MYFVAKPFITLFFAIVREQAHCYPISSVSNTLDSFQFIPDSCLVIFNSLTTPQNILFKSDKLIRHLKVVLQFWKKLWVLHFRTNIGYCSLKLMKMFFFQKLWNLQKNKESIRSTFFYYILMLSYSAFLNTHEIKENPPSFLKNFKLSKIEWYTKKNLGLETPNNSKYSTSKLFNFKSCKEYKFNFVERLELH